MWIRSSLIFSYLHDSEDKLRGTYYSWKSNLLVSGLRYSFTFCSSWQLIVNQSPLILSCTTQNSHQSHLPQAWVGQPSSQEATQRHSTNNGSDQRVSKVCLSPGMPQGSSSPPVWQWTNWNPQTHVSWGFFAGWASAFLPWPAQPSLHPHELDRGQAGAASQIFVQVSQA